MNSSAPAKVDRFAVRSTSGYFKVFACAATAIALPIFGAYREANPLPVQAATWVKACDGSWIKKEPRRPVTPEMFLWAGIIVGAFGVLNEIIVRRQLDLARSGEGLEAIVDEVHIKNGRYDTTWIKYGFLTPDGKSWHGKCHVAELDAMGLSPGTRISVLYDAANPKRHCAVYAMWGVTFEEPETA